MNHLEFDWESPVWRHLLGELAGHRRLIRYDERGTGLSDREVEDISFEAFVRDLEGVVDALALERFALLGISQGAAVSMAYAVRHPERVTHLVLHGGYAKGWRKRQASKRDERNEALLTLIKEGWGQDNPAFRQVFTSLFIPGGTSEQMRWFNDLQRITTSPENAVRIRQATGLIDVSNLLPHVEVPTLVTHSRHDAVIPFALGQDLASEIPGARFVPLDSRNHVVLEQEPAWPVLRSALRVFLGTQTHADSETSSGAIPSASNVSAPGPEGGLRWSKVDAVFDRALDRPEKHRSRWLDEACAGDDAMRAEVARLLELCEKDDDDLQPNGALTGPIWDEVAGELESPIHPHAFRVGDQVGAYEILRLAGRGGMGQVYVAQDKKLGRNVALKVLPPGMNTAEYRKRFEREAKAVAALNHPNIVHLYSVEEANGIHFITMELVEGKTLAEEMLPKGLPVKTFLHIAIHLADALGAAHERGVIHRDLKPTNVMVSAEGRVKILDFGLAKLKPDGFLSDAGAHSHSTTMQGHIVGTVSHMSPEQAEGKELDHRTDVFSLGVILYEMSTGQVPFRGESTASILSAIMKDTPREVSEVNPRMPAGLSRVIKKCLAKDRSRRYQTALDIRDDLEDLQFEIDSRKLFQWSLPRSRKRRLGIISLATAAIAGVIVVAVVFNRWWPGDSGPVTGNFHQITSQQGPEMFPSLSPDGKYLVYAGRSSTSSDIFLLRVGGRNPINLTEESLEDDTQPAYSPNGEEIAFRSARDGGGIFVMGATGELARKITSFGWNPTWSPDGKEIAFATEAISRTPADRPTTSELWVVEVETGTTRLLTEGDGVQPSWSPNGYRIAYWGLTAQGGQRDIWTLPVDGGEPRPVTEDAAVDWSPVWSPDGRYIYFSSDRGGSMNVWRIPIDEKSGEVEGEPEPVTTPSPFASHMSFSSDGRLMAFTSTTLSSRLQSVAFDPATATVVDNLEPNAPGVRDVASPHPSPDGEWVAFSRAAIQEDIVLVRPDGSDRRPATDDPYRDRHPRWSPDGKRIAFYSNRGGSYEIWAVSPDGGELEQLTDTPDRNLRYPVWSPDGARMVFSYPRSSGTVFDLRTAWDEQIPEPLPPFTREGDDFVPMDWSPDGSRLVGYIQSSSGIRSGIAVLSLETREYEIITDFGLNPVWLGDSRRILFQAQSPLRSREQHNYQQDYKLYVADRRTKEFKEVLALPGTSVENPTVSTDNRSIYFSSSSVETDVWTMTFGENR